MRANATFFVFGAAGGTACALGVCLTMPPLWDWSIAAGVRGFVVGLLLVGLLVGAAELTVVSTLEARHRKAFRENAGRLFDAVPQFQVAAVAPAQAVQRLEALPATEAPLTGAGGAPDPKRLAQPLIDFAISQRAQGDFAAAIATLEQALILGPDLAEAHLRLGQTLSYHAAEIQEDPGTKQALLDRAEKEITRATELDPDLRPYALHDRAWIDDERGEFEKAIAKYEEARATRPPDADEDPALGYNLACALAQAGREEEALAELAKTITVTWESAEQDGDLKTLRESPQWRERFAELIENAKRAAGGAATSAS